MSTTAEATKTISWAGGDVSSEAFDVCFYPPGGDLTTPASLKRLPVMTFERTQEGARAFIACAKDYENLYLVLESTGTYSSQLAGWIIELCPKARVCIVNPRRILTHAKTIGMRNKSDAIDARVIASYAATFKPAPWQPDSPHYQLLQTMTRTRQGLVEQLTCQKNQLQDLQRQRLTPEGSAFLKAALGKVVETLKLQIKAIEDELLRIVEQHQELKKDLELADSIPGVGELTGLTIMAELGDVRRFKSRKQLETYAGINVGIRQSGRSLNKTTGLTKEGSARLRRCLYLAAMAASKTKSTLGNYYSQLVQRNKPKKAALGALMRKILATYRRLIISEQSYHERHVTMNI